MHTEQSDHRKVQETRGERTHSVIMKDMQEREKVFETSTDKNALVDKLMSNCEEKHTLLDQVSFQQAASPDEQKAHVEGEHVGLQGTFSANQIETLQSFVESLENCFEGLEWTLERIRVEQSLLIKKRPVHGEENVAQTVNGPCFAMCLQERYEKQPVCERMDSINSKLGHEQSTHWKAFDAQADANYATSRAVVQERFIHFERPMDPSSANIASEVQLSCQERLCALVLRMANTSDMHHQWQRAHNTKDATHASIPEPLKNMDDAAGDSCEQATILKEEAATRHGEKAGTAAATAAGETFLGAAAAAAAADVAAEKLLSHGTYFGAAAAAAAVATEGSTSSWAEAVVAAPTGETLSGAAATAAQAAEYVSLGRSIAPIMTEGVLVGEVCETVERESNSEEIKTELSDQREKNGSLLEQTVENCGRGEYSTMSMEALMQQLRDAVKRLHNENAACQIEKDESEKRFPKNESGNE